MPTVATLLGLLRASVRQRQALLLENAGLRLQIAVLTFPHFGGHLRYSQ